MAVVVTATVQDVYPPRVQIAVTGLTLGDDVEFYRVVSGVRTFLRNGGIASVIDTSAIRIDAELPFGVPISYLVVVNGTTEYTSGQQPALNANPYFETNAANWSATGGAITRSTAQFHEGVASGLLTPDGVTAVPEVRSENVTGIVPLHAYRVAAWLRCPIARSANANIVWRDGAGTFLSSAGAVSVSLPANTWTPIEMSGTAPSSAAQAQISLSMGSTPPITHLLYIDEARLSIAAPVTVVYVLPGGKVALSDAITGLSAEVVIMAWPEKQYTRQVSVFQVGGYNKVVSGPAGQAASTVELFTETTSQAQNLSTVADLATEAVVQIRQPGGYDGVDGYYAVLGKTERRFSQDGSDQRRLWSLEVAEVLGWSSQLAARGFTFQDVMDAYDGLTFGATASEFALIIDALTADWGP